MTKIVLIIVSIILLVIVTWLITKDSSKH